MSDTTLLIVDDERNSHFDPDITDAFLAESDEFVHIAHHFKILIKAKFPDI